MEVVSGVEIFLDLEWYKMRIQVRDFDGIWLRVWFNKKAKKGVNYENQWVRRRFFEIACLSW